MFRGKYLEALQAAHGRGELRFTGELAGLVEPPGFARFLTELRSQDWVVYSKPPFAGPEQVLAYLGRYTHRIAISHERLLDLEDDTVRFRYRDYARGNRVKVMRLGAEEFIRRFLLHVLPPGFMRIRHYGLLANRCRAERLDGCRALSASQRRNRGNRSRRRKPCCASPASISSAAPTAQKGGSAGRPRGTAQGYTPHPESDRTPTALMTTLTRPSLPRPLPCKPATVPFGLPQPLTRTRHLCHSAWRGTSHPTETARAVHAPHNHPTSHTPSGPNAGLPPYNPHRPAA